MWIGNWCGYKMSCGLQEDASREPELSLTTTTARRHSRHESWSCPKMEYRWRHHAESRAAPCRLESGLQCPRVLATRSRRPAGARGFPEEKRHSLIRPCISHECRLVLARWA